MKSEVYEGSPPHSADEALGGSRLVDSGISLDRAEQLQRGLKSRHIQFLALGGA